MHETIRVRRTAIRTDASPGNRTKKAGTALGGSGLKAEVKLRAVEKNRPDYFTERRLAARRRVGLRVPSSQLCD